MYAKSILIAACAATLVAAHGKVQLVTGDKGGAVAGLGIKDAATVDQFGKNAETEQDTTVYGGNPNKPMTDGLGKTTDNGAIKVSDLKAAMAVANSTVMPQVSGDGTGTLDGTWRVVTSDGTANDADGNLFAILDTTGTGAYSTGTKLVATSEMVGNGKGNVVQRTVERALKAMGLITRATNVGADAKISVKVPAGTTCTGSDATSGAKDFCLMKIANNNGAGPFGGNVAFQIAAAGAPAAAKRFAA